MLQDFKEYIECEYNCHISEIEEGIDGGLTVYGIFEPNVGYDDDFSEYYDEWIKDDILTEEKLREWFQQSDYLYDVYSAKDELEFGKMNRDAERFGYDSVTWLLDPDDYIVTVAALSQLEDYLELSGFPISYLRKSEVLRQWFVYEYEYVVTDTKIDPDWLLNYVEYDDILDWFDDNPNHILTKKLLERIPATDRSDIATDLDENYEPEDLCYVVAKIPSIVEEFLGDTLIYIKDTYFFNYGRMV